MAKTDPHVTLTVLVENCAGQRGLLGEHGWAVWVESGESRVLFDTGQGLALRHNARALGIELGTAQAVVLSHGHYDHADGLVTVQDQLSQARLFLHPGALQERYAGSDAQARRAVGSTLGGLDAARGLGGGVVYTRGWTEVAAGVWASGEIPRRNEFEQTNEPFFLDAALQRPDPFLDDQALVLQTTCGLAVVLGCAHAGVANTLDYVAEQTKERRFALVVGGMHLRHASRARIDRTVAALRRHGVQRVGPAHCTGLAATAELMQAWGNAFLPVRSGVRVRL